MEKLVTVTNLSLSYGKRNVINQLNFVLNRGEFMAILGENGVGKTTLIKALLHQIIPKSGSIDWEESTPHVGYVPQFRNLSEEYPLSVIDFVKLNLTTYKFPWYMKDERIQLEKIIEQSDLSRIANRPLGLASGGEKQRAYLAQALVGNPELLILDESTASLDNEMKYELLNLVKKFQQIKNISVLFISHDWPLVHKYADRFLLLQHDKYITDRIDGLANYRSGGNNV